MALYLFLTMLLTATIGALMQPVALIIRALAGEPSGALAAAVAAASFIAQFLLWVWLAVLITMGLLILKARYNRRMASSQRRSDQPVPRPVKMAVAITAYNESLSIAQVVREFKGQDNVVEVIVVDNNSRDNTAELAASAGARVVHEIRQGYGYACIRGLREGLAVPEAEAVVLVEGDGTFDARDLAKFQAYIHQSDMVIGTRLVPGLVEKDSQLDYFFSWGNLFISLLLRLRFWEPQFLGVAKLTDVGCTYRVIRREALNRILPDLVVGGNHFSPHMILVALAHNLSIVEVPVTFRKRVGESKGASQSILKGLEVGLQMIWHIITYRRRKGQCFATNVRGDRSADVEG